MVPRADIVAINEQVFGRLNRSSDVTRKINELAEYLKLSIYEFVEKFVKSASRLGIDDDAEVPPGPLSMAGAPEKLKTLIDDAVKKGAKVVLEGKTDGTKVSPTILDHVTPDMEIYYEESFGPVCASNIRPRKCKSSVQQCAAIVCLIRVNSLE